MDGRPFVLWVRRLYNRGFTGPWRHLEKSFPTKAEAEIVERHATSDECSTVILREGEHPNKLPERRR